MRTRIAIRWAKYVRKARELEKNGENLKREAPLCKAAQDQFQQSSILEATYEQCGEGAHNRRNRAMNKPQKG